MDSDTNGGSWSFTDPRQYLAHARRGLEDMPPLIVTVAITGGAQGRESNEALPETPEAQAASTYDAWNAGASIVHVHARRPDNLSMMSHDTERYREINALIRDRCPDIVINNTMAGDIVDVRDDGHCGFARGSLRAGPEMASVDCGPIAYRFSLARREAPLTGRDEEIVVDDMFTTTFGELEDLVDACADLGVKPEFELFNSGQFSLLDELVRRPSVAEPFWVQFVMGAQNGNYATPMDLLHLAGLLHPGSMFSVIGIGPYQLPLHSLAIVLGGHVRVGMEDNLYLSRGRRATSNAEFVERVVSLATLLGRRVASPAETRALLGLDAEPSSYAGVPIDAGAPGTEP